MQKHCKNYNNAFTLAEILITIAIIGVVASLTIKNVMVNSQKMITEVKLKKTFAEFEQAFQQGVAQNGFLNESTFGLGVRGQETSADMFNLYIEPYLKIDKICSGRTTDQDGSRYIDPTSCGYKENNFWKRRDGQKQNILARSAGGVNMHRVLVKLQSGAVIYFQPFSCNNAGESASCTTDSRVIIDIDGPKGINTYGRDVFLFQINTKTNKLVPLRRNIYAPANKENYNDSMTKCKELGHWCADVIVRSGWKIPSNYPW